MTWSGAVTANAAGNPVLRTYEHTCTAPQFPDSASYPAAREVAFGNTAYAGTDKAGSTLDRAMEGYFVAIEMSELLTDFGVVPGQPLGAVINAAANCPAISAGWDAVFRDLTTDTGVAISEGNSPGACELFDESRYARDGQPNILSDTA